MSSRCQNRVPEAERLLPERAEGKTDADTIGRGHRMASTGLLLR